MKKLTCALLAVIIIVSFTGCNKATTTSTNPFDEFTTKQFVESVSTDSISLHFSLKNPEAYGIKDFKPTFGDIDLTTIEEDENEIDANLKKLKSFNYDKLTASQKLTYDIMEADFTTAQTGDGLFYYGEIVSPLYGMQSYLPTILPEYSFYAKKDVDDYLALLKDIPRYFDGIIAFEKEKSKQGLFMSDKVADKVIVQCKDFALTGEENVLVTIFSDMIAAVELAEADKTSYISQNKEIITKTVLPAYEKLAAELTKLKGTGKNDGGLANFPKGKEFYTYLFKSKTGSSKSVDEMIKIIDTSIINQVGLVSSIAMQNPTIIDELTNIKYDVNTPEEILGALKTRIVDDYPPLKDVPYTVKQIHKSLEGSSSPAFYLIPPIDSAEENVIYTNNGEQYKGQNLFSTLAHEGYPGHLYQTNYFLSTNPAPIRRVMNFGGYTEGWATYVENHSYELANQKSEALVQFLQIDGIMSLALSTRIDIGVNYEGWKLEDTKAYLEKVYVPEVAEMIAANAFNMMIEEPGNTLPYCIGYFEFIELQNSAKQKLGEKFVLKDFNKTLLDIGPAPFSVVKTEVEKWMATV